MHRTFPNYIIAGQIQSAGGKALVMFIGHRRAVDLDISRNLWIRILGVVDAVECMGV
jgi:hypothetical protein